MISTRLVWTNSNIYRNEKNGQIGSDLLLINSGEIFFCPVIPGQGPGYKEELFPHILSLRFSLRKIGLVKELPGDFTYLYVTK